MIEASSALEHFSKLFLQRAESRHQIYQPGFQAMAEPETRVELQEQPQLEAETTDNDSAYGESTKSSFLTSIASEVTRGLFENGRRYHS